VHDLARHWIDNIILQSPVARAIGVTLHSADVDQVTAELSFSEDLTTTPGLLHGGVIASLIDTLGAAGSASGVTPDQEAAGGATSHLAVNYLAPARTDLTATATVVHRTRSGTLTDVYVRDTEGTLVAMGQVTSRFFR
jgi:uncharacterized protein (TIGR00369 family)